MDPTVAGALIGGGAALIGFGASAWQNAVMLRANRQAARDQRLWEKRTALYEALIEIARRLPVAAGTPADAQAMFDGFVVHQAQVFAYASSPVLSCYISVLSELADLARLGKPGRTVSEVEFKLEAAEAGGTTKLVTTIRAELQQFPAEGAIIRPWLYRITRAYRRGQGVCGG